MKTYFVPEQTNPATAVAYRRRLYIWSLVAVVVLAGLLLILETRVNLTPYLNQFWEPERPATATPVARPPYSDRVQVLEELRSTSTVTKTAEERIQALNTLRDMTQETTEGNESGPTEPAETIEPPSIEERQADLRALGNESDGSMVEG